MQREKAPRTTARTSLVIAATRVGADGVRRLACARAFRLSAAHGIPLAEIGRICNENGVKIRRCQLGLFR